ncbi:MAG TPA: PLDc N-terminal domain-containing protein [Cyclobacteriaceae bacterium]|nr:PLDc N-terminal domain-containing protein [Cyclobacteriaceae bacterium]
MNSIFLFGMPGVMEWGIILVMGLIHIAAIVDIMNNSFRGVYTKWIWCAIVVFMPLVGPLLYVWIGREQRVVS